jgi:hypothetical protein
MGFTIVEGDPFAEQDPAQSVRDGAEGGEPGLLSRFARGARDLVTGEDRTEFPDAPEFLPTYANSKGPGGQLPDLGSATSSAITPDPEAQFDILSKSIPGLQRQTDKFGNLMLKAPGVDQWTYLNKPGASARDLDEFGTQTLATAPFLGWAGKAGSVLGNIARGAVGMGAASVAQDAGAIAQGSEQGVDGGRAAVSTGLGAAIPAVIPAVKGTIGAVTGGYQAAMDPIRKFRDPKGYAERQVQGAFQEDASRGLVQNISPAERQTAANRGQDLRTMDYGGETVRAMGRKAANISPAARDIIMRTVAPRYKGQSGRLVDLVEGEMGFDRSVKEVGDQLKVQARQARQPLYDQSYRAGADGVSSPALDQLTKSPLFARAMQRANVTMQDRAAIPGLFTTGLRGRNGYTLEYWDQVKQRLDDMHSASQRSGANAKALDIDRMRRALRDELDTAVPRYRSARSTAETYFDASDALEAGAKFSGSNKYSLQDAQQAIGALNAQEKNLFSEGYASDFVNKVRTSPDRSDILNRVNASQAERDKFRLAMGGGRADQLEAFLRLEGIMDTMRNAMGNSTTARQLTELGANYGLPIFGTAISTYNQDPTAIILGFLLGGAKMANQSVNRKVMEHVADLLTSKDPDIFLQGIQQAGKPGVLEALRAIDNAISSAGIYRTIGQQAAVNASQEADPQSEREKAVFDKARGAIDQGADRTAVMKRLRDSGINPRGL